MCLKIAIFLLIAISSVSAQEFLFCLYSVDINNTYTCSINIYNPSANLDFNQINGTHLPGFDDDNVLVVKTGYATATFNIPPIICNKFQNIETISYRAMGLELISNEAFEGCTKVKSIDLSNNQIKNVDENSFRKNDKLERLFFESNELVTLPENVFLNNTNLVHLDLEQNKIVDLPAGIFKSQENLQELKLITNQIVTLNPEWFKSLKSLNILHLSSNKIDEIPEKTFNTLASLKTIWMNNNQLQVIHSKSFGQLPNLDIINFMNNQIKAIDEKILDATGITAVIMIGNVCNSGFVFDNSTGRPIMRAALRPCFDEYEVLFPRCPIGDLDNRVCTLEDEHYELLSRTATLAREKDELEKKFDDQVREFNLKLSELQSQIDEIRNPSTTSTLSTTDGAISSVA